MGSDGNAASVALGKLVNTHGVRGELRLRPYNPETGAFVPGRAVCLARGDERRQLTIRGIRPHKQFLLVQFEGVGSANQAEDLIGFEVCADVGELPRLDDREVYHFELVGMEVRTTDGTAVGTVRQVFTTAAHDVCAIDTDSGEVLLPLVPEFVVEIDRSQRRLVVDPPGGLLEARP